jgi:mannose-1-phosphate guanylyltransferase
VAISIRQCDHRWVIVLAGGSGTRLSSITRDRRGSIVPKQYCSLRGDRSLLRDALERAAALAVEEQTLVVVAAEHEEHWSREFRGREVEPLVVQPRNRGTAAGVLLPLFAVLQRDPEAVVTLLPSDHFVAEEWTLADALRAAQRAAIAAPSRAILLGVDPDSVETDYGWILPAPAGAPGSVAPADA